MAGINGISAYQQTNQSIYNEKTGASKTSNTGGTNQAASAKASQTSKATTKPWNPIDTKSSLVPKSTEYGTTIGDVQLSDKAKDYLGKLKSKFNNMEFITVSKDMKAQVQQNAASYGNANKMVVLIDEEKLERMATDENFRKKYEGIIATSQAKMMQAKMGLTSSGASVKNFGMSVDSNGKENFFATVNKTSDLQKKRTEKKAQEERIQKARDKKAEKADTDKEETEITDNEEYVTFEADSLDDLLSKVQTYSYNNASGKVMTESEKMVGTKIDFRG